jgi:hypothetical protein
MYLAISIFLLIFPFPVLPLFSLSQTHCFKVTQKIQDGIPTQAGLACSVEG